MNRPAELSAKNLTNAPKQDLRTWLGQMDAADELQLIKGANREEFPAFCACCCSSQLNLI